MHKFYTSVLCSKIKTPTSARTARKQWVKHWLKHTGKALLPLPPSLWLPCAAHARRRWHKTSSFNNKLFKRHNSSQTGARQRRNVAAWPAALSTRHCRAPRARGQIRRTWRRRLAGRRFDFVRRSFYMRRRLALCIFAASEHQK